MCEGCTLCWLVSAACIECIAAALGCSRSTPSAALLPVESAIVRSLAIGPYGRAALDGAPLAQRMPGRA